MIPLINWLNSYESITTQFCCQGEPRKEGQTDEDYSMHQPYVLFNCINTIDLISILSVLGYRASVQIYWNEIKGQIEYRAVFTDQQALLDTIDHIAMLRNNIKSRMIHAW